MKGLDYSVGRPSGAAVKAAAYGFVVRYLAYPGARPKYITRAEAQDLLANGIAIALVWETTAGRALAGRQAGAADARIAASSARDVGQPGDRPIYFAVDQDVTTSGQMAAVDAYLDGAAGVLGRERIGVYGEHDVIEHCLSTGRAVWGWQTKAWSHGRVSARAHLLQEIGGVTVGGVSCDINTARRPDFGQWPAPDGEDEDMALSAEDKKWLEATVKNAARFYAVRGAQVMVAGHGNQAYPQSEIPKGESVREQIAAVRGELAGLAAAVTQLAQGGGLDAAQITAAAEAGARAALAELGETLTGKEVAL